MKNTQVKYQQSKYCAMNLNYILEQPKQSIYVNSQLHPTGTLATTLIKPAGEENPYVQFVYGTLTILNHTYI